MGWGGTVRSTADDTQAVPTIAYARAHALHTHSRSRCCLPALQSRVLHGVRPEILALSEIPFVKAYTARLLYRSGLR